MILILIRVGDGKRIGRGGRRVLVAALLLRTVWRARTSTVDRSDRLLAIFHVGVGVGPGRHSILLGLVELNSTSRSR